MRLGPDFLFMPLPTLPGPVILHLCMLLNPPDAQVLAFSQVVFQAATGTQDPSPYVSVKVPLAKVEIDLEILDVGKIAADIVGNGNKDVGIREQVFLGFEDNVSHAI